MSDDYLNSPDFALVNAFQRQVKECNDVRSVVALLAQFVGRYGFTTVGLGHMINPGRHRPDPKTVFQLSNWPKEWSSHWANSRLIMSDPVARFARLQSSPFRWSEAFADPRTKNPKVERLMRDFGFRDGLAIPMQVDGPPGVVSLGAEHFEVDQRDIGILHIVCYAAYSRIEELYGSFPYQSVVQLTPQQRAVLHYVAAGKTNWEIGKILEISEHSVRDHLSEACRRLGANGRAHAVAVAIMSGLILP
jgi:LuxR family quorum sensing-dependent transcriptional regulator